jgi:hypothetical protein
MIDKSTEFPQYRKLSNNRCFYEIIDERTFREIQCIGNKVVLYEIKATQYPEILRIREMLEAKNPFVICESKVFEDLNQSLSLPVSNSETKSQEEKSEKK